MVRLISYPFRLSSDGRVATTEDGIDYYAEELAMLIKTIPGERELVPQYGISDPTFSNINRVELLEKTSLFGPPIDILVSKSKFLSDGRVSVEISYNEIPLGEDGEEDDDDDDDEFDYDDSDEYDEEDPAFNFSDATDV